MLQFGFRRSHVTVQRLWTNEREPWSRKREGLEQISPQNISEKMLQKWIKYFISLPRSKELHCTHLPSSRRWRLSLAWLRCSVLWLQWWGWLCGRWILFSFQPFCITDIIFEIFFTMQIIHIHSKRVYFYKFALNSTLFQ